MSLLTPLATHPDAPAPATSASAWCFLHAPYGPRSRARHCEISPCPAMKTFPRCLLSLIPSLALAQTEPVRLDPVVVTAPRHLQPLVVTADPRAPAQPIPAHDGADVLKHIPGFSVIRKGGTDGDPVLRGLAGSRLGVQVDG